MSKYTSITLLCLIILVATVFVIHGNSNSLTSNDIEISPSIEVKLEWPHAVVIVLFIICVALTAHLHWCFIPFILYVSGQLIYSTWLLFDKQEYIKDQLDLSWAIAYVEDPSILVQLQEEWQCQGFYSLFDRPVLMKEIMSSNCYPILSETFGSTIFSWGLKMWAFKLIQLLALCLFYMMYVRYDNHESSIDPEHGAIALDDDDDAIIECIPIINEKEYLFHKQQSY